MFLTLCIAMLSMTLVQAQERTYSGTVKSAADGQVIIGANVTVVGTTQGTSTGVDGSYSIKARVGSQLSFSYLGMKTQTVTVGNTTTIDITLESEATDLEDVVVIAFGTAKKKDLTGSMSTIDSKILSTQSNSTVSRALEGAIPGLQVSAVDGQPGLDMGIRVRGIGSANQGNSNALIVIDGVPQTNSDKGGLSGSNPLASLNPKDIESLSVLKDAASTALYGARGANGVILITTKKGKQGKAKVSFEGRWGINQMGPNQYDMITDPSDVYEWTWKSIYNSVRYKPDASEGYTTHVNNPNMTHEDAARFASEHLFNYMGSTSEFKRNGLGNWMLYDVPGAVYTADGTGADHSATMTGAYLVNPDGKMNPDARLLFYDDWNDIFLQNKFRQEYNVNVSGASEKVDYYLSVGYLEDPSYVRGSSFNRYSVRSNINAQVTKWLKSGLNMSYARRSTQFAPTSWGRNPGSNGGNIFRQLWGQNPLNPFWQRNADGSYALDAEGNRIANVSEGQTPSPLGSTVMSGYAGNGINFIDMLENDQDLTIANDLSMRGYVEAKFLKDFTFNATLSYDNNHTTRNRYWSNEGGQGISYTGMRGKYYTNFQNINAQQTLTWAHDYGQHHVDVMLGHEFNWMGYEDINFKSSYSLIPGFDAGANFVGMNSGVNSFGGNGTGAAQEALEGYFARANYNYAGKYYLSASVRADGSSKFKDVDKRWGAFWSVGGAWRLSSESWMENASWVNDLKLRVSYGTTGNQNGVNRYSGYQTWSLGAAGYTYSGTSATPTGFTLSKGGYVNDALTWEKVQSLDVGLDFRLWDRFYGTIDFYNRVTTNAIWQAPIAYSLGQDYIDQNSARIRNTGIEIELGVDIIRTPDILWSVNVNGTHYRNKLLEVPAGVGSEELNGCWTAGVDGWAANGGASTNQITYLRGVGKDLYNMYLFKYAGIDQNTGLAQYWHTVDHNADENGKYADLPEGTIVNTTEIGLADRYEMGTATPDFIGGFGTSFRYKNFDFSAQFAFQLGGKFLSVEYANGLYMSDRLYYVSSELVGNTWTPENTGAKFPMQMYQSGLGYVGGCTLGSWMYTDLSLFKASYLNVKNITIGYNLPQKWMDKIGIDGIRVYASGDNLWMVTEHSGIDPRMSLVGGMEVGAYTYPYMRTWSLGVNVTF